MLYVMLYVRRNPGMTAAQYGSMPYVHYLNMRDVAPTKSKPERIEQIALPRLIGFAQLPTEFQMSEDNTTSYCGVWVNDSDVSE